MSYHINFSFFFRYKTLQMFHLQNTPEHVFQINEQTLCVCSKNLKGENSELLQLKIPKKLTLSQEAEGRSKDNDFKMVSGIFTKNHVYQTSNISNDQVITSEYDANGLQIYNFNSSELTGDAFNSQLKAVEWKAPNFAINKNKQSILCSKCNHEPLKLLDLNTGQNFQDVKHPFYTLNLLSDESGLKEDPCVNNIKCEFLTDNLLGILNINNACLVMHDIRSENNFSMLPEIDERHSKEYWTLSSCDLYVSSNYVGILSNCGNFYIYDIRNNEKVLSHKSLNVPIANSNKINLKFGNDSHFSISGFDSNVNIYNMKNDLIFTHNGHTQKQIDSVNIVNDHIWLANISDKFLLSICDNKSLNCWEFNE